MCLIRFKGTGSKDPQKESEPGAGVSSRAAALVRLVPDAIPHKWQHQ